MKAHLLAIGLIGVMAFAAPGIFGAYRHRKSHSGTKPYRQTKSHRGTAPYRMSHNRPPAPHRQGEGHSGTASTRANSGDTNEVIRRQADGTWRYVIDDPFNMP
jgi:hypothetical protein